MVHGQPQASGGGKVFDAVFTFLPDWAKFTVIAVGAVFLVGVGVVKIRRKLRYRRAVREGRPIHAAAQYGQRRGADYLGSYAPTSRPDGDLS
jgi:hypothetical protein